MPDRAKFPRASALTLVHQPPTQFPHYPLVPPCARSPLASLSLLTQENIFSPFPFTIAISRATTSLHCRPSADKPPTLLRLKRTGPLSLCAALPPCWSPSSSKSSTARGPKAVALSTPMSLGAPPYGRPSPFALRPHRCLLELCRCTAPLIDPSIVTDEHFHGPSPSFVVGRAAPPWSANPSELLLPTTPKMGSPVDPTSLALLHDLPVPSAHRIDDQCCHPAAMHSYPLF
jgi:hypothetical protein